MKFKEVMNKDHTFGEVDRYFILEGNIEIERLDGQTFEVEAEGLVFTEESLREHIERARKNEEDFPKSFWERIFG
ncbi:MAG: hypothetical protein SVK08_00490 [Halobacteriota archaeon]|nr:hypothetical protein [Halobacteriota archaeon]